VFTVIFTQPVRDELINAQDWYEGEAAGLGRRFREAIDFLTERISTNPRQFPIVFKNVAAPLCGASPTLCSSSLRARLYLSSPVFMPAAIHHSGKSAAD
jgi:hypothetical protein